jgi:hypothetical protein
MGKKDIELDPVVSAPLPLDPLGKAIHAFFLRKLGYRRVPQVVPLNFITASNRCTRNQARYRIKRLIQQGLLEKWTTKHPTHYKQTYYRIPYLVYKKISPPKSKATYAVSNTVSAYYQTIKQNWEKRR